MAGIKGMKTGIPKEGVRAKGAGRKPKFWDAGTETKKLLLTLPESTLEQLENLGKKEGLKANEYIYKIIFENLEKK